MEFENTLKISSPNEEEIKEEFISKLTDKIGNTENEIFEDNDVELKPDLIVSDKVKRIDIVRQIKSICEKTGKPVPKGYTKMKKDQLKEELSVLMNETLNTFTMPPLSPKMKSEGLGEEAQEPVNSKEDLIINTLFTFGLVGMDSIEAVSKLDTIKDYTGGMVINGWSNKFKGDSMMGNELKSCLKDIYAENSDWMADYLTPYNRLYMILGMSLLGSVENQQNTVVVEKESENKSISII